MRPISSSYTGHEVGDAGAVLSYAHTVAAGDPRIAIGHLGGVLFMGYGNETDARRFEQVEGVHVGRAHDPEHVRHPLCDKGLDEGFA